MNSFNPLLKFSNDFLIEKFSLMKVEQKKVEIQWNLCIKSDKTETYLAIRVGGSAVSGEFQKIRSSNIKEW